MKPLDGRGSGGRPDPTPRGLRRPVSARGRSDGPMSATATYRELGARGLAATEAANLTAYLHGIRPAERGWSIEQIDHLLFLRYLFERGRIRS